MGLCGHSIVPGAGEGSQKVRGKCLFSSLSWGACFWLQGAQGRAGYGAPVSVQSDAGNTWTWLRVRTRVPGCGMGQSPLIPRPLFPHVQSGSLRLHSNTTISKPSESGGGPNFQKRLTSPKADIRRYQYLKGVAKEQDDNTQCCTACKEAVPWYFADGNIYCWWECTFFEEQLDDIWWR